MDQPKEQNEPTLTTRENALMNDFIIVNKPEKGIIDWLIWWHLSIFTHEGVDNEANKATIVKKKKNMVFIDQEEFYSQVLVPVEETGVGLI